MLIFLIIYLTLFRLTTAEFELTLTRYKDTTSLSTGPNRTSISTLDYLEPKDWKTVEISDGIASYYGRGCIPNVIAIDELPEYDREWFQRAYNRAYGDDILLPGRNAYQPKIYKFKDNILKFSEGGSENFVHYEIDGYSVFMLDLYTFLITKSDLAEDCQYIWIDERYVAFVKRSGKILLFPDNCLVDNLMLYIENLRKIIASRAQADQWLIGELYHRFMVLMHLLKGNFNDMLHVMNLSHRREETLMEHELDLLLAQQLSINVHLGTP